MATQPHAGRIQKSGPPPHANSQRDRVLEILREAGTRGVSRAYFLFTVRITQVTARLNELEKMGYTFASKFVNEGDQYCTYYLTHEPLVPLPLPPRGAAQATHELCPHCGQTMPPERRVPTHETSSTSETPAAVLTITTPPVQVPVVHSSTASTAPTTLFDMGTPVKAWRDPEQCR